MATQKQTIILIAITASLVSFLAGYLFTQPSAQVSAVLHEQRGNLIDRFDGVVQTSTPTPLPPGLLQAASDIVLAPTNAADGEAVIYYHNQGVSNLDLETRKSRLISQASIPGLTKVVWSPDKNRVITVSRSTQGQVYRYFDYTTHEHGDLGPNITDAAFSPDSDKLVIIRSPGAGDGAIQVMDFKGRNPRTVLKTRLNNIKLSWPQENLISFKASDAEGAEGLYTLDLEGNLNQWVGKADHLNVRWSNATPKLIYSEQTTAGTKLHFLNIISKEDRIIPLSVSALECDWLTDNQAIMCAVQTGGETSIIRVPLESLKPSVLFSHLIITPQEVFLSTKENFLVIVSASDQTLWAVKLAN